MTSVALASNVQQVARTPLARVPAFAPVAVADWLMCRLGKQVTRMVATVTPDAVERFSEEDFCAVIDSVESAKREFDWYLSARGDRGWFRVRIKEERDRLAKALYCLRRGYAPGHLPSESDRLALGEERLREVT